MRGSPARRVIRAPNHLGDLVMALPALQAAPDADVLVTRWLTPVLELALAADPDGARRILPLDRGRRGWGEAVRRLRRERYDAGVLLPPSLSAAILFAAGGVRARRGTPTDGRRLLLTEVVPAAPLQRLHRSAAYHVLVTGEAPAEPPVPRLPVPTALRDHAADLLPPGDGPWVGVFPGSNASSRRWDAGRYAELAERLVADGFRVVVFGAPNEAELTSRVAGRAAVDLGGRTDLPLLAAALSACRLLVTNDSGPMHLAAAVGTRTVSLQGPADPAITRPLGPGHLLVQHGELPCVPCVRNVCPRRGHGYVLAEAERECMRLIEVDEVEAAVRGRLEQLSP